MIIEIGDTLVSSDILEAKFCCDLSRCKGACCVEGNSGAPLETEEIVIMEDELDIYKPFMKPEGIEVAEREGVMVVDVDGDFTTTLINDAECAFSIEENGVTLCAIEKAFLAGKTTFRKPISCHLYPIRVARFSNGTTGMNYHRWDICGGALKGGEPMFRMLREPIVRRFGVEFYDEMELIYKDIIK